MWKQIGNAVDGRLAKAIGDTFLKATLDDLVKQPKQPKPHAEGEAPEGEAPEAHIEPTAGRDADGGDGLGAAEPEG